MSNNIKFEINKEDDNPNPITKLAIMTDLGDLNDVVKSLDSQLKLVYGQQLKIVDMLLTIDGKTIRYVTEPTNDQMMKAVHSNGLALQYILPAQQTHDIQMEAVNNNPYAIEFAYNPEREVVIEAMKVDAEYDCENVKNHPIKFVKNVVPRDDMQDQMFSFILYERFLKANNYSIEYIKEDIRDLPGEEKLWLMTISMKPYTGYIKLCPVDIQEKIIDDVLNVRSLLLPEFDSTLYTDERCTKFIVENPAEIGKLSHMRSDVPLIDWFKLGLSNAKHGLDMYILMNTMDMFNLYTFDNAAQILEIKNALLVVNSYSRWFIHLEGMCEYIFEKFDMKDIVKNVNDDAVSIMIAQLPFFKRIKYKYAYKKTRKQLTKEKIEELTSYTELKGKPTINGTSLGDDKNE